MGRWQEDGGAVVDLARRQTDGRRGDGDGVERGREGVVRGPASGAGDGDRTAGESPTLIGADIRGAKRSGTGAQEDDLPREGAAHRELGRGDRSRGVIDLRTADRQRPRGDGHGARRTGEPVIGGKPRTVKQRQRRGVKDDVAGLDVGRAGHRRPRHVERLATDRASDRDLGRGEVGGAVIDLRGGQGDRARDNAERLGAGRIVDDGEAGLRAQAGSDQGVGPDVVAGRRGGRPGDRAGRIGRELGRSDIRAIIEIGRGAGGR